MSEVLRPTGTPSRSHFDYLIARIDAEAPCSEPFAHLYIEDFLHPDDFAEITSAPEISIPAAADDEDLFETLYDHGYQMIRFPGCIVDVDEYISWHSDRASDQRTSSTSEGFGVTLRLTTPRTAIISELDDFLQGARFNQCIADKFNIDLSTCTVDGGIQKYLDGYEISPHPDIRTKALTFMVNINPHDASEAYEHHTQYMQFKPGYRYVSEFWEGRPDVQRHWVPWDWCDVVTEQRKNNSIVVFSPSNTSLHCVRADYDHLGSQRTQLYGNLWYEPASPLLDIKWEQLDIGGENGSEPSSQPSVSKAATSGRYDIAQRRASYHDTVAPLASD